ncbi:MAG TPA: IPT/TIG domain-containing protein [Chloroflexia bacterium]|nr:IPT/TIG domain-containing protein [Chloroflexia bacterium]
MKKSKPKIAVLLRLMMVAAFAVTLVPAEAVTFAAPVAPAAQTNAAVTKAVTAAATNYQINLVVQSARDEANWPGDGSGPKSLKKGDKATRYTYIINEDNVGDTTPRDQEPAATNCDPAKNAAYPAGCNWPSVKAMRASAPIVTQGDNTDLNETAGYNLPAGKYLISVMANGFKIDGVHFTIPRAETTPLVVEAQPYPIPTATVRVQVFEDSATTNSGYDVPGERPLQGFEGHLTDVLGDVTTDWYGNPLCTVYNTDAQGHIVFGSDGKPVIKTPGGKCLSDANGEIVFPNIGPNRYTATVVPPNGTNWVQTTTLEGNHDYDVWVSENATGYDTEFTNPTAEATPPTIFGFVKPTDIRTNSVFTNNGKAKTGTIKGRVWGTKTYFPQQGGLPYNGQSYQGGAGTKLDKPVKKPWISLNALGFGDQAVWVGQGNDDGTFTIDQLPEGDYSMAYWDLDQEYILEVRQVSVKGGTVTDMGNLFLAGWWSNFKGRVCIDQNNDGKCQPTEPGLNNQTVTLKTRANSVMERGSTTVTTDSNGYYELNETYPLTSWIVMEVFNQRYYTTGVTYQADNQDQPTTVLGNGVDVSIFPIIGLGGTLDWAVRPYAPGTNGGIVGTVTYDTTRNETDARYSLTEVYQPGIPGLHVNLYAPVACADPNTQKCDPSGRYQLEADGSYKKGPKLNTYESEEWQRPTDCVARGVDNKPLPLAGLPLPQNSAGKECIEAPMMGTQFQTGFSTVDGNYGFTTITADPVTGAPIDEKPMPAGDYLVQVDIPKDPRTHKPVYQVTREEDVNVFKGDQLSTQEPPPICAGSMHTVDVKGSGNDGPNAVDNPEFVAVGGSPYEGMDMPLCDMKLISVKNGRSIAPNFNFFTPTPLPGRWNGYIVDDLNLSTNPKETLFGEKRGLPNSPIGIYDWSDRLITTVKSDPNGLFEVLMPSTSSYNCPLPAGVCPSVYRLVGNDPGQPYHLNPDYDPQYRTISASFEIWPGLIIPADLAPTRIGSIITQGSGSQFNAPAQCKLADATPQLFAVSKPYVYNGTSNTERTFTISGQGFGATRGSGKVQLDDGSQPINLQVQSWSDTQIVVRVPSGTFAEPYQLRITAANGQSLVNGLTFHVLESGSRGYKPRVYEVGPGKQYDTTKGKTIQSAIEDASRVSQALVVVYPGTPVLYNPLGVYYENLIIHSPIKLQGVGPGGVYADGTAVTGSVLDGLGFWQVNEAPWNNLINTLRWDGNQQVYEGAVITVLARRGQFGAGFNATIDGLAIQGGDQLGTPNKVNSIPNGGVLITQGGGIFVNAWANNLQVTNNIIRSNGGAYGGGIRLGTAYVGGNHNYNVKISQNRIIANGGTNLAGGVAIFGDSNNYELDHNDICGNYSSEYGGGISHYGLSRNGSIHHNRIYFNNSFDEGGGVMIAGELPADPNKLSTGAGPVDIYNNLIQDNLSNDDGGGLRFLMAGNFQFNVYNNMIVNNVSTHEGGGIALDDAPNVRIFNNTIMKNITTATAATSNGQPAPAGIATGPNSVQLQNTLPRNAPTFSDPVLFNNIFWDNRAGTFTPDGVSGIGLQGDPNGINYWDVGSTDGFKLSPTYSFLNSNQGVNPSGTNSVGVDPKVKQTFDSGVAILPWRTNPYFIGASIVAVDLPVNQMGDYHLQAGSPAIRFGVNGVTYRNIQVFSPTYDYDDQLRRGTRQDIGADQY